MKLARVFAILIPAALFTRAAETGTMGSESSPIPIPSARPRALTDSGDALFVFEKDNEKRYDFTPGDAACLQDMVHGLQEFPDGYQATITKPGTPLRAEVIVDLDRSV